MPESFPPTPSSELRRSAALERLRRALASAGWSVSRRRPPSRTARGNRTQADLPGALGNPDLVLERDGARWVIDLQMTSQPPRKQHLQGLLAQALLQARAHAEARGARPLAVVAATSLSDRMVADLTDWARRFARDTAIGFLDERGRLQFVGEGLEGVDASYDPPDEAPSLAPLPVPPANPFRDLGQWLLKLLLAPRIDERWIGAPRLVRTRPKDLIEASSVSPASVYEVLAALRDHGHLQRHRQGVELVRVQALLSTWRAAARRPVQELPVRPRVPGADWKPRLLSLLAGRAHPDAPAGPMGNRACLGLFAACDALGLGHVRGAPLHLLVESLSHGLLDELQLEPTAPGEPAPILLRRPTSPESTFRACVPAPTTGAPTADALQCWLDVTDHPTRGNEQAEHLAIRLGLGSWVA